MWLSLNIMTDVYEQLIRYIEITFNDSIDMFLLLFDSHKRLYFISTMLYCIAQI